MGPKLYSGARGVQMKVLEAWDELSRPKEEAPLMVFA